MAEREISLTRGRTDRRVTGTADVAAGPADVRLSVVADSTGGRPVRSRWSRWRAFSLAAVHLLIVGHVLHWLWAARTVTPIEPSEAMETVRTGQINAGFIFFAAALLATLVLGRWVCGWGCHLVAYQDLMLWILKKLHLRPKALRSRLLVFVPLVAALYMFVWPLVGRWWEERVRPSFSLHLTRVGFWDTFPGWVFGVLTIGVCGLAIVYFLGPKGFCTYACPYGAFFGLTDKLAPGRIRVTDACQQCGHCTAVCTSNVDVKTEVRQFGMVVDPGCMKCLDCVGTCPSGALYYGFGPIPLGKRPASPRRTVRWDMSLWEESLALLIFGAVFFAYRGLYGRCPFLFSLGVAGIAAYLGVKGARLFYARDVFVQRIRLKVGGRLRPMGVACACGTVAFAALTVHSALWRYHDYAGHRAFARSPREVVGWQYDPEFPRRSTDTQRAAVITGLRHLEFCRRWGLMDTLSNRLELAWLHMHNGSAETAVHHLRRAVEMVPDSADLWTNLAMVETARGDDAAAESAFAEALRRERAARERLAAKVRSAAHPASARIWTQRGMFLASRGDQAGASAALAKAVAFDEGSLPARTALGMHQIRMGEIDAARRSLIEAVALGPRGSGPGGTLADLGGADQDFAAAVGDYRAALRDHGEIGVFHNNAASALTALRRYDEALGHYRAALRLLPEDLDLRGRYGAVLMITGDVPGAIREYEVIADALPANAEAAGRLAFLYARDGRPQEAVRLCRIVLEHGDEDQRRAAESILRQLASTADD